MAKTTTPKVITKKKMARIEREAAQRKYLYIGLIVAMVLAIGSIAYGLIDTLVLRTSKPVAKVGDTNISLSAFERRVHFERWYMIRQYTNNYDVYRMFANEQSFADYYKEELKRIYDQVKSDASEEFAQQVLDGMIEEAIVAREAKARGISVSDEEVNLAFESQFGFFPNGTPTPSTTPTEYIPASTSTPSSLQLTLAPPTATATEDPSLALSSTPKSEDAPITTTTPTIEATATLEPSPTAGPTETITPTPTEYTEILFKTNVANIDKEWTENSFSEAEFRTVLKAGLLQQRLLEAMNSEVKPEQEKVWARHILLADEETAKATLDRLNKGEDWVKLAAELSQDTSNKDKGGDLGWFSKGQMVAEFEEAAFALKVGEISQPVKTSFGYHIIQVIGHENRPLEASEYQQLQQTSFTKWLDAQKAAADVQQFPDLWKGEVVTEPTLSPDVILSEFLVEPTEVPVPEIPSEPEPLTTPEPEATPEG